MSGDPAVRVKCLINQPIPYNIDLLNAVAAHPGIDLSVVYLTARERASNQSFRAYPDQAFRHRVLAGVHVGPMVVNRGILPELRAADYDVMWVAGYSHPALATAVLWLAATNTPYVFWADTLAPTDPRNPIARAVKRALQRTVFRTAASVMMTGSAGMASARARGCSMEKCVDLPYCVDPDRCAQAAAGAARVTADVRLRAEGRPVLLFVGQLIARKGPDVLVDAAARLRASGSDPYVVFAGAGPLLSELRGRCETAGVVAEFPGFLQLPDLAGYFRAADLLVLPSRWDAWPLVVLESLVWGVPVVASTACGSARDRIRDGENGALVSPGDPDALAAALRRVLADPDALARLRDGARATAEAWPPSRSADVLARVVASAVQRPVEAALL